MSEGGDSKKVFSTDGSHTRLWEEKRSFSDEPGGPPKPRKTRTPRPGDSPSPNPPALPRRDFSILEIEGSSLFKTSSSFIFSCDVDCGDAKWSYLTKEMTQVSGRNIPAKPDIFWLEEDRRWGFDTLWRKYANATKLVVKDGPMAGWVGFIRVDE